MQIAPSQAATEQPAQPAGFPPFKTETFPAQFFWLAVTFTALLIVMRTIAVPRIGGSLSFRKAKIDGDLAAAEAHRKAAEKAAAGYAAAMAAARSKANALAEENRQRVQAEVETAKAKADAGGQAALKEAEARIAAARDTALTHVHAAARDAAMAIVERLLGESVPADEADAAIRAPGQ